MLGKLEVKVEYEISEKRTSAGNLSNNGKAQIRLRFEQVDLSLNCSLDGCTSIQEAKDTVGQELGNVQRTFEEAVRLNFYVAELTSIKKNDAGLVAEVVLKSQSMSRRPQDIKIILEDIDAISDAQKRAMKMFKDFVVALAKYNAEGGLPD